MQKGKNCKRCGRPIRFKDDRDYCNLCGKIVVAEEKWKVQIQQWQEEKFIEYMQYKEGERKKIEQLKQELENMQIERETKKENLAIDRGFLNVLAVIDAYGWAYDFIMRGIKRYSKHNLRVVPLADITKEDVEWLDVLYCMHGCILNDIYNHTGCFKYVKRKCVGIFSEVYDEDIVKMGGWNVGVANQKIYDDIMQKYQHIPFKGLYVTRAGVDTEIFKPMDRPDNRFIVGWVGWADRPLKRYRLLKDLNFPFIVQTKWGWKFFVKDRSRDEMIDFYSRIDCLINTSDSEAFPLPVLEAAATGLPVVATRTSGVPEFIDSEWLVPINPEHVAMREMNSKLQLLKDNLSLRKQVGEQNLQKVLNRWTWKYMVKEFDKMFEES